MKMINGKNKKERTINKLKKYFDIDVKALSGKYFEIEKVGKATFAVAQTQVKRVKGDLFLIDPVNNNGKPFFAKDWATFNVSLGYGPKLLAFAPFKEEDIKRARALTRGKDDIFEIKGNQNWLLTKMDSFNFTPFKIWQ